MIAVSLGGIAAIVAAAFWGVLVIFLALVLVNLFRLLDSIRALLDGIRRETVPLLGEVRLTVTSVNRELDRADEIMVSAAKMAASAENMTSTVERAVTTPFVKLSAFSAGVSRAFRRLRRE